MGAKNPVEQEALAVAGGGTGAEGLKRMSLGETCGFVGCFLMPCRTSEYVCFHTENLHT